MITDITDIQIHITINIPAVSVPSLYTILSLFNTQKLYYSFKICYVLKTLYSCTYDLFVQLMSLL